jgi:hypothetical protein
MMTGQEGHRIQEAARDVPVVGRSDVVVVGSGPAGSAAALAAARSGVTVQLIEANGCLGGMWTAGLLAWMFEMDQPGIPREITQRLERRGARIGGDANSYTYDIEEMKRLLEELCLAAGIRIRLHTRATGVRVENGRLTHVITESKSGREAWRGACFVDASGDGDLAALAGCGFDLGRPGSGECQPLTYMALIAVRDARALSPFISFWQGDLGHRREPLRLFAETLARAGVEPSYAKPTLFQVRDSILALMINHEYGVSALDASQLTQATLRGRAEVNRVVEALRGLGGVWEGVRLVATCEHIGVREGRRIQGLATVTQEDLAQGRMPADGVCRVTFGVDVHCTNPAQGKGQEPSPIRMRPYQIPLRALIARDVSHLTLAGRCISGDFIAHSSYRVTGTAAATGQAAGVAAALSAHRNRAPAELAWSDVSGALKAIKTAAVRV